MPTWLAIFLARLSLGERWRKASSSDYRISFGHFFLLPVFLILVVTLGRKFFDTAGVVSIWGINDSIRSCVFLRPHTLVGKVRSSKGFSVSRCYRLGGLRIGSLVSHLSYFAINDSSRTKLSTVERARQIIRFLFFCFRRFVPASVTCGILSNAFCRATDFSHKVILPAIRLARPYALAFASLTT
jgi:hypothetical protein